MCILVRQGSAEDPNFVEPHLCEVRKIYLLDCEYPGEWLWATSRTGLTLLLGEPKVPCK